MATATGANVAGDPAGGRKRTATDGPAGTDLQGLGSPHKQPRQAPQAPAATAGPGKAKPGAVPASALAAAAMKQPPKAQAAGAGAGPGSQPPAKRGPAAAGAGGAAGAAPGKPGAAGGTGPAAGKPAGAGANSSAAAKMKELRQKLAQMEKEINDMKSGTDGQAGAETGKPTAAAAAAAAMQQQKAALQAQRDARSVVVTNLMPLVDEVVLFNEFR